MWVEALVGPKPGVMEPGRYSDTGVMLNEARGIELLLLPPELWDASDITRVS